MIVSKYSKSYDTADGSEQLHGSGGVSASLVTDEGRPDRRWEDDGGPATDAAPRPAIVDADKPTWSVRSLRRLLDAVRQSKRSPTTALPQRAEENKAQALQAEADRQ